MFLSNVNIFLPKESVEIKGYKDHNKYQVTIV